jgi:type I restriction enzyme S subunit
MSAISGKPEDELDSMLTATLASLTAAAALFPDAFVESELGKIPAGWHVSCVGELMELTYGKGLTKGNRRGGTVPVYGSGGVDGYHDEALANGPGIIIGRKGSIGTVRWVATSFYPIDTVFYVIPRRDFPMWWAFEMLRGLDIPHLGSDSAVPGVNRNTVYAQAVVWPGDGILNAYGTIVAPLAALRTANETQSVTLAALRDTLLPKLMSGEVDLLTEANNA